jgi:hypothetical protein
MADHLKRNEAELGELLAEYWALRNRTCKQTSFRDLAMVAESCIRYDSRIHGDDSQEFRNAGLIRLICCFIFGPYSIAPDKEFLIMSGVSSAHLVGLQEPCNQSRWCTVCQNARIQDLCIFYRPLLLGPEGSPFRTSGSQSWQYHVRDCGSSVRPTQSRWNYGEGAWHE